MNHTAHVFWMSVKSFSNKLHYVHMYNLFLNRRNFRVMSKVMGVVGKIVWLCSVSPSESQRGDTKTLFKISPAKRVLPVILTTTLSSSTFYTETVVVYNKRNNQYVCFYIPPPVAPLIRTQLAACIPEIYSRFLLIKGT